MYFSEMRKTRISRHKLMQRAPYLHHTILKSNTSSQVILRFASSASEDVLSSQFFFLAHVALYTLRIRKVCYSTRISQVKGAGMQEGCYRIFLKFFREIAAQRDLPAVAKFARNRIGFPSQGTLKAYAGS